MKKERGGAKQDSLYLKSNHRGFSGAIPFPKM